MNFLLKKNYDNLLKEIYVNVTLPNEILCYIFDFLPRICRKVSPFPFNMKKRKRKKRITTTITTKVDST